MTVLADDPRQFADDALTGLVAAHRRYVQRVHGGVVRATASPAGEVAVVLGGGSGHYPAFAGWVGPGMAHAAACGNVFASPSASQIYSVARAADNGGGVVFGFGNYAGDVLHFGQAAERLRAEGVDVRVVTATDDIASGRPDQHLERRGIAGDLPVFKVMGAAAAAGMSLDEVERVSRRANDRTRSLGVAFSGCTLPGADHPLFTVPEGSMAIGLGIHGEPGIEMRPRGSAAEVADLLVDGVLAEEPPRGADYTGRVALLLNGLGATKYEEIFVVYGRVAERMAQAGIELVQPEVGEHVTSLDMAGLSLTATFLDAELESLWTAPVDTPAFRRGTVGGPSDAPRELRAASDDEEVRPGSPDSRALAAALTVGLRAVAAALVEQAESLGDLDAVAGDGDHGQGMVLGSSAALRSAEDVLARGAGARTLLVQAGAAWSEGAGGTSGALWGAALTAAGGSLTDDAGASADALVAAVRHGADAVLRLGGAEVGDKTMVDALVPFVEQLERQVGGGADLPAAWSSAATAAREAADGTAALVARRGRARTHGEHSRGTPDPGAVSFAVVVRTVADLVPADRRER